MAIVDLWNVRNNRFLTQAATLTHEHPAALAIRQEAQILHANRERTRPPRELAWALAMFVYSLSRQRSIRWPSVPVRNGAATNFSDDAAVATATRTAEAPRWTRR